VSAIEERLTECKRKWTRTY